MGGAVDLMQIKVNVPALPAAVESNGVHLLDYNCEESVLYLNFPLSATLYFSSTTVQRRNVVFFTALHSCDRFRFFQVQIIDTKCNQQINSDGLSVVETLLMPTLS